MKKIIFCTLLSLLIFVSCGTTRFATGLKQIQLGMTKQEIISLLGNSYKLMGSTTTPDGILETWKYYDPSLVRGESGYFILNFLNGELDEWHREYPPVSPQVNVTTTTTTTEKKD